METSAKVVGGDKDVVGAMATVPKRELTGDDVNGGGQKRGSMSNSRKAIKGTKITWNINRKEEEISFIRVQSPHMAGQKGPMNSHLRSKQMAAAPAVGKPIGVEFWRQIVDKDFQVLGMAIIQSGFGKSFWGKGIGIGEMMN